ncbi:MAG: hypothetical protein OEM15_17340 [Myxococcales bacterium]|nr:hypothetical protein [Myxococcales bacterium]
MIVEIELDGGHKAEIHSLERNVLTFWSSRAFPPGAPVRFGVLIGEHRRVFEGRSIGARRVEGDRFEVRMRFVNLRRGDREGLLAAIES